MNITTWAKRIVSLALVAMMVMTMPLAAVAERGHDRWDRWEDESAESKQYVTVNFFDEANYVQVSEKTVEVDADATKISAMKAPKDYKVVSSDWTIRDGYVYVGVEPVESKPEVKPEVKPEKPEVKPEKPETKPERKTVTVNIFDEKNYKQVEEYSFYVKAADTEIEAQPIPKGYELVSADWVIRDGYVYVGVKPVEEKKLWKTVTVNVFDEKNYTQVEEYSFYVKIDDTEIEAQPVPAGYELVSADWVIRDGYVYMGVKPVEVKPTHKIVTVNIFDEKNYKQVEEYSFYVKVADTEIEAQPIPEGYELVSSDWVIRDGYVYVGVKPVEAPKTHKVVTVNMFDEANYVQVEEYSFYVKIADTEIEPQPAPVGYKVISSDWVIRDGYVYVGVEKIDTTKEVTVNYYTKGGKDGLVGTAKVKVEKTDRKITEELAKANVPAGYEFVESSLRIGKRGVVSVFVKEAAAKDQTIGLNYYDATAGKQAAEVEVTVPAGEKVDIAVVEANLPKGYEIVSTDYVIRDGYVYIEVKAVADECDHWAHTADWTYESNNNGTHDNICVCGETVNTVNCVEDCVCGYVADECDHWAHTADWTYESNNNGTHDNICVCGETVNTVNCVEDCVCGYVAPKDEKEAVKVTLVFGEKTIELTEENNTATAPETTDGAMWMHFGDELIVFKAGDTLSYEALVGDATEDFTLTFVAWAFPTGGDETEEAVTVTLVFDDETIVLNEGETCIAPENDLGMWKCTETNTFCMVGAELSYEALVGDATEDIVLNYTAFPNIFDDTEDEEESSVQTIIVSFNNYNGSEVYKQENLLSNEDKVLELPNEINGQAVYGWFSENPEWNSNAAYFNGTLDFASLKGQVFFYQNEASFALFADFTAPEDEEEAVTVTLVFDDETIVLNEGETCIAPENDLGMWKCTETNTFCMVGAELSYEDLVGDATESITLEYKAFPAPVFPF